MRYRKIIELFCSFDCRLQMHYKLAFLSYVIKSIRMRKVFWHNIKKDYSFLENTHKNRIHSTPVMLIVSTGRTGTTWLANTLSSIDNVVARHEPIPNEQFAWSAAFNDASSALWYAKYRVLYIEREIYNSSANVYIEANGAIRRHIQALKTLAPEIYIPHVIRDGRAVVTSIMNRNSITEKDPYFWAVDKKRCLGQKCWGEMNKFEIACSLWKIENEYMLKNADHTVRFEDMITDYSSFSDAFCNPVGIKISYDEWYERTRFADNKNKKKTFPGWGGWSKDQKQFFLECCGEMMERFDYFSEGE